MRTLRHYIAVVLVWLADLFDPSYCAGCGEGAIACCWPVDEYRRQGLL